MKKRKARKIWAGMTRRQIIRMFRYAWGIS